jgi:hypothetical protein
MRTTMLLRRTIFKVMLPIRPTETLRKIRRGGNEGCREGTEMSLDAVI